MTQPDPDPTNREQLVPMLADATRMYPRSVQDVLDALDAAGYQIVPKVELERTEAVKDAANELVQAERNLGPGPDIGGRLHWRRLSWHRLIDALDFAAFQALDKENG